MHWKRGEDFGDFEKVSELSWVESSLGRRLLTFACSWRPCTVVARDGGGWKSHNRKNVYLSPYLEEPLNSKVIKCFVPEIRIVSLSRVSRFLCSMYICYEQSIYVSRISVSGYSTYIYLVPELGMSFMAWLRLGSTCIKETIRETARNIGSISSGLFRRWKERGKTQGLQKKRNKEKSSTTKTRRKNATTPERRKEKKKEKKKKNSSIPRKKNRQEEKKKKRRRATNEKKKKIATSGVKKKRHKKKRERKRYLLIVTFIE